MSRFDLALGILHEHARKDAWSVSMVKRRHCSSSLVRDVRRYVAVVRMNVEFTSDGFMLLFNIEMRPLSGGSHDQQVTG